MRSIPGGGFATADEQVSGLVQGLIYHFTLVASNASGSASSPDATFQAGTPTSTFHVSDAQVLMDKLPTAPEGYEIARVDVVVRLRRKR